MYPEEFPEAPYTPHQANPGNTANKAKKRLVIIVLAVLLLVVGAAVTSRSRSTESFQPHVLSKTGLSTTQNFGYLQGSDLYSYNGMAFYKTSIAADGTSSKPNRPNRPVVLNSGLKLPVPNRIYWADSRGALLSFKQSYSLTKVEEALTARQEPLNDITRDYTWYLDFATGSLQLVNQRPIVPDLAYYSASDKGFYYVTGDEDSATVTPLYFYNIESGRNALVSKDLDVIDVGNIRKCAAATVICFTARDTKDPVSEKLYGIDQSNQKKVIFDSKGRLFATNDTNLFVVVVRGEDEKPVSGNNNVEQADHPEEPASLYNIQTSTTTPLGFDVGMSEPIIHFSDAGQFYVIDNGGNTADEGEADGKQAVVYRTGRITGDSAKSELQPLVYSDNKAFDGAITGLTSHGSGGRSLLTAIDGGQVIFSDPHPQSASAAQLASTSLETAKNTVKACIPSGALDNQYFEETREFRVSFAANERFAQNIASFSSCMARTDNPVLTGYTFHFAGRDPFNGRLSTD